MGNYRPLYHIIPPQGWLNDPNGSVYFNGAYHIWFQYSPESPEGSGGKYWGHYTSPDLVHFTFRGISISPDKPYDCDGVYSGTAWIDRDRLELYYTGNVKHPGNYDYINEGRGHNVVRVTTEDGLHFSEKELLLENKDYPADLSCHVRDPKIFREDGTYYMLLGARRRDSVGGLLLMKSADRKTWTLAREYFPERFGYMLECPDYFQMEGENIAAFCPQGVPSETWRFQNVYESGYVFLGEKGLTGESDEELNQECTLERFQEWDMGFDFYAPQTFLTPDGRRILIGWAGVPDAPYGNAPAIAEGWQHTMTVPRELTLRNGRLYELPVRELGDARGQKLEWNREHPVIRSTCFDLRIEAPENFSGILQMNLNDDLTLLVDPSGTAQGAVLRFLNQTGDGRDIRRSACSIFRNARILMDRCMLEIFLNDGEVVFTTRYYPDPEKAREQGGLRLELPEGFSVECNEMTKVVSY